MSDAGMADWGNIERPDGFAAWKEKLGLDWEGDTLDAAGAAFDAGWIAHTAFAANESDDEARRLMGEARDERDAAGLMVTRLTAELAAANAVIAEVRSVATRQRMIELAADALSEVTYTCSRTWEAWQYNTMSEDDFAPAWEDDELLASVVDSALEALDGHKVAPAVTIPSEGDFEVTAEAGKWYRIETGEATK